MPTATTPTRCLPALIATSIIGYRHDTYQVARAVRYYSHAEPSLHLAPRKVRNGHRIRLWGSAARARAGGRVVVLQASALHARRWLTFAQGDRRCPRRLSEPLPLHLDHRHHHLPDPRRGAERSRTTPGSKAPARPAGCVVRG